MTRSFLFTLACAALLASLAAGLHAASPPNDGAAATALEADPVQALADKIDRHIAAGWQANNVTATEPATDEEYIRRVYLDIDGRIPTASEVREFLRDDSPDKRRRLVDELLDSPGYVRNWTAVWRDAFIPEAKGNFQAQFTTPSFEAWLRGHLRNNTAYDAMVQEVLTASLQQRRGGDNVIFGQNTGPSPNGFFQAKENKPENLAAASTRLFLGVRVECAQCHDHPFAKWKQEEFWSTAAFFAANQPAENLFEAAKEVFAGESKIKIPDKDVYVSAKFLDGSEPATKSADASREAFAEWVTADANPYFAPALANRMWGHFFGTGIVDPIDDFDEKNPPSHPDLLADLAHDFIEQGYDLKFVIRAITASKTYQLSSKLTDPSQEDPRLFAKAAVRGLGGEQLWDSLVQSTGISGGFDVPQGIVINGGGGGRDDFLQKFEDADANPTQRRTSIVQALALMNGSATSSATSLEKSETLLAVIESPFFNHQQRIETLYLSALSRKPTEAELEQMLAYVKSGGPQNDWKAALSDVYWALLNSSEFISNH